MVYFEMRFPEWNSLQFEFKLCPKFFNWQSVSIAQVTDLVETADEPLSEPMWT